jgi:hypothetical protein
MQSSTSHGFNSDVFSAVIFIKKLLAKSPLIIQAFESKILRYVSVVAVTFKCTYVQFHTSRFDPSF